MDFRFNPLAQMELSPGHPQAHRLHHDPTQTERGGFRQLRAHLQQVPQLLSAMASSLALAESGKNSFLFCQQGAKEVGAGLS